MSYLLDHMYLFNKNTITLQYTPITITKQFIKEIQFIFINKTDKINNCLFYKNEVFNEFITEKTHKVITSYFLNDLILPCGEYKESIIKENIFDKKILMNFRIFKRLCFNDKLFHVIPIFNFKMSKDNLTHLILLVRKKHLITLNKHYEYSILNYVNEYHQPQFRIRNYLLLTSLIKYLCKIRTFDLKVFTTDKDIYSTWYAEYIKTLSYYNLYKLLNADDLYNKGRNMLIKFIVFLKKSIINKNLIYNDFIIDIGSVLKNDINMFLTKF